MRYAIDRYSMGSEKEVDATFFDTQPFIPARRNRFYCPECGEIVYFRAKGGNKPSHFYHQEKDNRTPECDRRVDGRSQLSLSERIGLPVYLTTLVPGAFHISIGFPAIGQEMLQKAAAENYVVEISFGNQARSIKVDQINFISDEITLIPVDFIPSSGQNYTITISGKKAIYGLRRKWSNYADGFEPGGAIFSCGEFSSKKVRRGDSISTNRQYYVVTRTRLPYFDSVDQFSIDQMNIGRDTFFVYRIKISTSIENKQEFSRVSTYFKNHFGVWLLEYPPELVPVWPPVVQRNSCIPVTGQSEVLCAISSGNEVPNVYVYSEYGVSQKELGQDYNGIKTVKVSVGITPTILSVDRKYVGREVSFVSETISHTPFLYEIGYSGKGGVKPWDEVRKDELSSEFSFISNSKMDLYIGLSGKAFRHIPIRAERTLIPATKSLFELFVVVGSLIIKHIDYKAEVKPTRVDEGFVDRLYGLRKVQLVPIPRWVDSFVRRLKSTHNYDLFQAVVAIMENGMIPVAALPIIRTIELETKKENRLTH